jgi:hypothetical protein
MSCLLLSASIIRPQPAHRDEIGDLKRTSAIVTADDDVRQLNTSTEPTRVRASSSRITADADCEI